GARRARARCAHRRRHADPRPQARRSGADRRARLAGVLHRLPRLEEDPRRAAGPARRARVGCGSARSPARPGRAVDRRPHAGRDRGVGARPDHRGAARRGMTFGELPVGDAVGAVLAHTLRAGDRVLKKGRVLSAADVAALADSGRATVVCARLDAGELAEDAAATRIATALAGPGTRVVPTHTGRTNLHSEVDGLFLVDRAAIAAANAIDEAITLATVPAHQPVRAGEMVATVKIIPFGVAEAAVAAATESAGGAASVRPWRGCRAGLVLTRFADTAPVILERAASAQRTRMARCGGALVGEVRVHHDAAAVAEAIRGFAGEGLDPILVLGASAIMDRRDVIPAALERAGGSIVRLGMPVDPGNLLLLGRLGAGTVI